MKHTLCVKLCHHNFTKVIVHKLLVHGHHSDFGLHSLPSKVNLRRHIQFGPILPIKSFHNKNTFLIIKRIYSQVFNQKWNSIRVFFLVFENGTILKMCSEIQPPLQSGQSGPDQSGISVALWSAIVWSNFNTTTYCLLQFVTTNITATHMFIFYIRLYYVY